MIGEHTLDTSEPAEGEAHPRQAACSETWRIQINNVARTADNVYTARTIPAALHRHGYANLHEQDEGHGGVHEGRGVPDGVLLVRVLGDGPLLPGRPSALVVAGRRQRVERPGRHPEARVVRVVRVAHALEPLPLARRVALWDPRAGAPRVIILGDDPRRVHVGLPFRNSNLSESQRDSRQPLFGTCANACQAAPVPLRHGALASTVSGVSAATGGDVIGHWPPPTGGLERSHRHRDYALRQDTRLRARHATAWPR